MSVNDFTTYVTPRVIANRAISLEVTCTNYAIRFLGSTMPANVDVIKPGESGKTQIVFYPEQERDGLVALCIRINRGKALDDFVPAFFSIIWKEKDGIKYPFINLEDSWVTPERIGHVTPSSIDVVIKGKRFSSYKSDEVVYVPDGNLLCHYIWGTASALEVLHAAVQEKVEPVAAKRIEQLSREIQTVTQECSYYLNRIDLLQNVLDGYSEQLKAVMPVCKMFRRLPTWMQPKSIRDLIKVTSEK